MRSDPTCEDAHEARDGAVVTITELLSYRIAVVANMLSRGAAVRFRSSFGISLGEWRIIALLGEKEPRSLNELGRAANLDIGQASRVVSVLSQRAVISRDDPSGRGRPVWLTLTDDGRKLYEDLIAAARGRHESMLASLTDKERRMLDRLLDKLTATAKSMLADERREAQRLKEASTLRKAEGGR